MPLRVLYLINTLRAGGAERNVTMICKFADRNKIIPTVAVLHSGGRYFGEVRAAGTHILELGRARALDPLFAVQCAKKLSQIDVDLVHVCLPTAAFYVTVARTLFRLSAPVVFSEGTSITAPGWRKWVQAWFLRRHCSAYLANSEIAAECLQQYGVARQHVRVIPNGHLLQPVASESERSQVRRCLGLSEDALVLIFVGRLIKTKRVEDLIHTARLLRNAGFSFRLLLAGDGPERGPLTAVVKEHGLEEQVAFLGERADVPDLLRASDIFLFSSEVEGLPNALIEAALAGLPIVAADAPVVKPIAVHGQTALLVPPRHPKAMAEAILRLAANTSLRKELGANARARATEQFSVYASLESLYQFYSAVVQA